MPSSSTPGFDLRAAIDSLRETFGATAPTGASDDDLIGRDGGGDIRDAILIELNDESMHGYQIIRAVEIRSGGVWKPSPGSVYPTLQVLVDEGLVTAAQVGERKVYSLTETGRLAAADSAIAVSAAPDSATHGSGGARSTGPRPAGSRGAGTGRPRDEQHGGPGVRGAVAVAKSGASFTQALAQVAQTATPDQAERAIALVDEARRKLYAILAED